MWGFAQTRAPTGATLDYRPFSQAVQEALLLIAAAFLTRAAHSPARAMSPFDCLLIGHLVADWMLQNDWMARNKQSHWLSPAIVVHCTIYTFILMVSLWLVRTPALNPPPYPLIAVLLFLSHWLIDAGNLAAGWMRLLGQSRLHFVQVMIDQTLHVLVIALLVGFLF
jgi:hypothetical protein